MEKMAIFVEGQTEQAFAEGLVLRIAGERNVHVDSVRAHGGSLLNPRQFLEVEARGRPAPSKKYYVIIYDSSNDSRVLSDIIERYAGLVAQGFREIIGIRDVYPQSRGDVAAIRGAFAKLAPTSPVPVSLVLSVMEIEAWFIAEHNHFPEMHPTLTPASVAAALGYDPATHDSQLIPHPAGDLKRAYDLAKLGYNKSKRHVQRTVSQLNYAHLYFNLRRSIPDLDVLASAIDRFMS